jgi:hypothetical protein
MTTKRDLDWALNIQDELAIPLIYSKVWPKCEIQCLDDDPYDRTKNMLDISGADKIIRYANGLVYFLGQRFRRYESTLQKDFDDFTLRKERKTGYKAEAYKAREALEKCGLLAAYYAYGHVNKDQTGFEKFRILNFREFLKQWITGKLTRPRIQKNKDGRSDFYYWPFEQIPTNIIFWELENTSRREPLTIDYSLKNKEVAGSV